MASHSLGSQDRGDGQTELRHDEVLRSSCTSGHDLSAPPSGARDEHQSATRLPMSCAAHAATTMGPISKRTTYATPPSMVPAGPPPTNELVSGPNTTHTVARTATVTSEQAILAARR